MTQASVAQGTEEPGVMHMGKDTGSFRGDGSTGPECHRAGHVVQN